MAYETIVKRYLTSLQREYLDAMADNQHTAELSFRVPLDLFLKDLANELNGSPDISVVLEPRNQAGMGRPDWRIHDRSTLGVYGYVEGKGLTPLAFDITPHEPQFNRYLSLGHKLIITDGIDFLYSFDEGTRPQIVSLIDKAAMTSADWSRLTPNPLFKSMMERFFSEPSPQYYAEGELVELVALRTRILSDDILFFSKMPIDEAMDDNERNAIALLNGLRELVYNHNDSTLRNDKIFSDFSAQVIMFSILFAHRIECTDNDSPTEKEQKIRQYLSHEVIDGEALRPFLKIIQYINSPANDNSFILTWTDECIRFLSFVHMTNEQRQQPDYHKLFELFLSKFDARSRFDYGAYYTPAALADYVVKLSEAIAVNNFGESLFSDGNTLIDPCCGTGSFLEQIRTHDARHGAYTLCGIEILPAPYMLANYRMATLNQRIAEYRSQHALLLANTLSDCVFGEPANTNTIEGFELDKACQIASRPITFVVGNPPSSDSARKQTNDNFAVINRLMNDFRPPEANRHGRQNTQKQINNPHLQFLRWACAKLEASQNHSILAFILPSSFLEAESYKYARKYITETFSDLWIVSVDADARAGIRSDSMFNTQQGRIILFATHRYGEAAGVSRYKYFDISRYSKEEKMSWFSENINTTIRAFSEYEINHVNFGLCPEKPFNQELYSSYWPISGDNEPNRIFLQHCSGIKLAPTSLFTHIKTAMLKRRSKEIMRQGITAASEWLSLQDKPPKNEETNFFAAQLTECGNDDAVDLLLSQNIVDYAFRPFLPVKAFLWQDLLQRFSHVGGGGTRRRPEISAAFNSGDTIGFALSHSPKDQKEMLKQFASFCWYYPDNDLCRRGNSYIYLNQYPISKASNAPIRSNINPQIILRLGALQGLQEISISTEVVFYTYAVLCSQVYLDEFEGALYTVNRADMRPRIPFVSDAEIFIAMSSLGRKIANLEKKDYVPKNHMGFDFEEILDQVPAGFRLQLVDQPFDEENETITLTDGTTAIRIPCPIEIQRINIAGYDILKNVWMKFNSYAFTHCPLGREDVKGLLDLINKLAEYIDLVGEIDEIMHDIVEGRYALILPPQKWNRRSSW